MAKRKRLSPAALPASDPAPETKATNGWVRSRAPIADVSADAAVRSAFEEVSAELRNAKTEGRMVAKLPLETVEDGYLVRDRLRLDPDELASLQDSLRARGQQMPIEVVDLGAGRYGLISGWRRMQALRAIAVTDPGGAFSSVLALVRNPDNAAETYRAMVEENEIRADLSFYERARIALKSVEQKVFPDVRTAVQSLFSSARAPKRSKIVTFTVLVEHLDEVLRWPEALSEKSGLAVAAALKADIGLLQTLRAALQAAPPADAGAERRILEAALRATDTPKRTMTDVSPKPEVIPGVTLKSGRGRITLTGDAVTPEFAADLRAWLIRRKA